MDMPPVSSQESYEKTGDMIDANINSRLIENIFFKNSPLHDGAMIIAHDRIMAAGCILPVSHDINIPRSLGLRHRSALGIAQATDAKRRYDHDIERVFYAKLNHHANLRKFPKYAVTFRLMGKPAVHAAQSSACQRRGARI